MPDCPYCERSFADESDIRKHLYENHEYDELSRIDTRRVGQYVDDHDLGQGDNDDIRGKQVTEEPIRTASVADRHSGEQWELDDVQTLSITEITDKLAEYGIDTTEASFRDRAAAIDSAMSLADQWEDDHDVDVPGYDQDFIWMAAEVLWERWDPTSRIENGSTIWYRAVGNSVKTGTTPRPASGGCVLGKSSSP